MEFSSLGGGNCGEHNGVDFVEMSKIFTMQIAFFFRKESLDRVLLRVACLFIISELGISINPAGLCVSCMCLN